MKAQVFILPSFLFEGITKDDSILIASGFLGGILVNCTTREKLMEALESAANFGHYAEVTMLKDDEPWPDRVTRIQNFIASELGG